VDEHERALSFGEIARELLAVFVVLACKVEDVILDLKGSAEKPTESAESVPVYR